MDRFHRGLISGIIAGIVMNILNLFNYYFGHFTTFRMLDWAGVMLYGHTPVTRPEEIYALIAHLLWTGILGIIFSLLVPKVTSRSHLTKGAVFGFGAGFLIYAFAISLRLPNISRIPFKTALSNGIEGILWGIVLAYTLRWLDKIKQPQSLK